MCDYQSVAAAVSVLALQIARGKTADELNLLAAAYSQLGAILATIGVGKALADDGKADGESTIDK